MKNIGTVFARIFSIVLHPLLMPLYSVALLFIYTNFYNLYVGQMLRFLFPVLIFTCIIPSLFSLMFWKLSFIKDIYNVNRIERIFPLIIFFCSNISLLYFFYTAGVYLWFLGLVAIPAFISLTAICITFFWKISLHLMAIGGVIGGVLSVCLNVKGVNPFLLFIILFLLSGCLGVSRLFLDKSTPAQVYVGSFLGLILGYISVFVAVYWLIL